MRSWKENLEESKQHYLDWWKGEGLVLSMWEHLTKEGASHEEVTPPAPPRDLHQYWFDPQWRAASLHHRLSRSSFKADILPVANTHLGPGSLALILGARPEGGTDTIWIHPREGENSPLVLDEDNPWWKLHLDLLKACRALSEGRYFIGCPDLVEGLDVLASIRGTQEVLMDMLLQPEELEQQLCRVNEIYFTVFDRICDLIRVGDEMAYCYFSIWAPGTVSKLQSDISIMISEEDFRRFVQPYIRAQCQKIDYTLYHLDGVGAIRHLDAILEIEELKGVQWTPGAGEPQGGDPCWYDLYRKIKAAGKSVMPCWVSLNELEPLLDQAGPAGMNILMDFKTEKDIDTALKIAGKYRS